VYLSFVNRCRVVVCVGNEVRLSVFFKVAALVTDLSFFHSTHIAVYHKCNPDSMEMYIAPIVGSSDKFMGSVYVLGHEDDDRCVFGRHDNDDETFYRLIRFEQCGRATNRTDVSICFTFNLYFHHSWQS